MSLFITESDLIKEVFSNHGLKYSGIFQTGPIIKFEFENIKHLIEWVDDKFISLIDKGYATIVSNSGYGMACVYYTSKSKPISIQIGITAKVDYEQRGVVITPYFQGESWGAEKSVLLEQELLKLLKRKTCVYLMDEKKAKTLLDYMSNDKLVLFHSLGLAGIRPLSVLFDEFCNESEGIFELYDKSIISFAHLSMDVDNTYVRESDQPYIFSLWKNALDYFKDSLICSID